MNIFHNFSNVSIADFERLLFTLLLKQWTSLIVDSKETFKLFHDGGPII